jgi:MFS family permease
VGILILLFAHTMPMVWVYAVFFGFCMGGHLALQPLVVGHFFGIGSFGTIYGVVGMAGALGSAAGPIVAGTAFDLFGSYSGVFAGCVCLSFTAAIAVYLSKPMVR